MVQFDMYTCGTFEVMIRSDGMYFSITSDSKVIATLRRPYRFLKSGSKDDGNWQIILPNGDYLSERGFWGIDSALQALRHHRQEATSKVIRRTMPR